MTDAGGPDDYPKVLIVGQPLNLRSGGGITVNSLFDGWPEGKLAVASGTPSDPECVAGRDEYRLGALEDRWVWPLSMIPRHGKISGPVSFDSFNRQGPPSRHESQSSTGRTANSQALFHRAVDRFGTEPLLRRLGASGKLVDWVRRVQPEVLYTQLSTLGAIDLVSDLLRVCDVGLVIHIMDDWPSVIYEKGPFSSYLRRLTEAGFRRLIERANVCMAISDGMAEEYEGRYRRGWAVFHNTVDAELWGSLARRVDDPVDDFRVVYTGRVSTAVNQSVEEICQAVDKLVRRGRRVSFTLYTYGGEHAARIEGQGFRGVSFREPVPTSDIPGLLVSADLLALPLDFDERSVRFARLSFPTKTAEYMASGTPILLYAPADSALVAAAGTGGWAEVVAGRGADAVADVLDGLIGDPLRAQRTGACARSIALSEFDGRVVRARFRDLLAAAAARERL